MHPNDRKKIKKANLADARKHYPYKAVLTDVPKIDLKEWLIKNRYRSWKQKGLAGDYFTRDNITFWFREEEKRAFFILALK